MVEEQLTMMVPKPKMSKMICATYFYAFSADLRLQTTSFCLVKT